jgi:hypothetical protein
MGRHSAPDEEDEDVVVAPLAVETAPPRGRHARSEDGDSGIEAEHLAQPAPATVGKGNQSTAADVALLRQHSEVRARVVAAGVVPIILYTVALYATGALGVYFIWVWIPLVTSGVAAGRFLDSAHRKYGTG